MVKVKFFINSKFVMIDNFDELPSATANYDFDGRKYSVMKREKRADGVHEYHLSEKIPDVFDIKKQAFDMFRGDKDTDVVMPDGQVVPSIAKAVDLIISNS